MKTKPMVQLTRYSGNAFLVIGKCVRALKEGGADDETIRAFKKEATSGDYDNLLRIAMKYCDVR